MADLDKAPEAEFREVNTRRGSLMFRRESLIALPESIPETVTCVDEEAFATLEKCISDAKQKSNKRLTDAGPLGKWIAERKAKSKNSQKRKEEKNALRSARYHYYDVRSPRGNVTSTTD